MELCDVLGRRVRVLVDELQQAGEHTVIWDGREEQGVERAPGVYVCRMSAAGHVVTASVVVMR